MLMNAGKSNDGDERRDWDSVASVIGNILSKVAAVEDGLCAERTYRQADDSRQRSNNRKLEVKASWMARAIGSIAVNGSIVFNGIPVFFPVACHRWYVHGALMYFNGTLMIR